MKLMRRYAAGSTVIAVTAAAAIGVGFAGGVDAAEIAAPPMAQNRPSDPVLTLITGDRLTLHRGDRVGIEPGPGRDRVTFTVTQVEGHLQVVPSDAWRLIQSGRVDARLFDVTALVADGYDDTSRADLPLLVTQPFSGVSKAARAAAPVRPALPRGLRVTGELPGIKGVAARVPRADRAGTWVAIRARGTAPTVPTVWLDGRYKPTLDVSVPQIGAPTAWAAGFTGAGVTVAVVDTGIDETHPDLAGKVIAERNFVDGDTDTDGAGHGTHVASTIVGGGAASGGQFRGVAPDARLVDAKVCSPVACQVSDVIAGMEWAVVEQHARIVNVSLGGIDSPEVDPMEQAVHELSDRYGALFVIAAGNRGHDHTIDTPGSAPEALTVGAVDSADALARFSSRGPAEDAGLKPDITAPGVDITAARSKDSDLPVVAGQYTSLSGTSMATPHVAGAAAILAQQHPDWLGPRLKAALMGSARPNPEIGIYGQGAGRVDVARAVTQTVTTSPASVNFGFQRWPHPDDPPVTRAITYHNAGPSAVTLNLAIEGTGSTAPGTFSLSATSVTVPAGGQTAVTLSADIHVPDPGVHGGYLVATSGGSTTRTPFVVEKEVESYDLDFTVTNRAGNLANNYVINIFDDDGRRASEFPYDPDGTATIRLPKGRHIILATVLDVDPADPFSVLSRTALLQPVLDLHGPASMSLDARTAGPIRVSIPRADATQHVGTITWALTTAQGSFALSSFGLTFDTLYVGAVGGDIRLPGLSTVLNGQWARANADGTFDDSPFTYTLSWEVREQALNGFRREIRDRDLARVDATYMSQLPDGVGSKWPSGRFEDNWFGISLPTFFRTPFRRTEFYTAGPDIRWDGEFDEINDSNGVFLYDLGREYRPGRFYRETWNQPMFGPAFPAGHDPSTFGLARRIGDVLLLSLRLFGDRFGHAGSRATFPPSRVTLERDGVRVPGQFGFFLVPPEAGTYKLTQVDVVGAPFTLSTTVSSEWTFRSEHAVNVALPLLAVRFHPHLDDAGSTPANRTLRVPVTVEAQFGSSTTATRTLSVDVSYDDGGTWTDVPVEKDGHDAFVRLRHPAKPGFVSLRASATDTSGNSVTQTIIRAYRIT
jgi:subtilisin family serine protease